MDDHQVGSCFLDGMDVYKIEIQLSVHTLSFSAGKCRLIGLWGEWRQVIYIKIDFFVIKINSYAIVKDSPGREEGRIMNAKRFEFSLALLIVVVFIVSPVFGQGIEFRHRFQVGQTAKTQTDVQMQGDSFVTGEKAATQMQMQMIRDMKVTSVDGSGAAKMNVTTQRIRTQGKMENTSYNKDLTGAELKNVMYGADQVNVQVSPLGFVSGEDDQTMQKLGISLPTSLSDSGGFEFPTFPIEALKVGDAWTENGQLLRGTNLKQSELAGQCVYKLLRMTASPQGRIGVIRYQKVTDLSGLGLGGATGLTGQNASGSGTNAQVGGLVIQLQGEIEFNIDQGIVVKTTQQGTWTMDMNLINSSAASMAGVDMSALGNVNAQNNLTNSRNLTTKNAQQKTGVKQNMKIKIGTLFQWTGQQKMQQEIQQKVQQPMKVLNPPVVKPPVVTTPPKVDDLPVVKPEKKELP